MNTVSYCTTCKGRLWQLIQTLPNNIQFTSDMTEIVILDYHSDDGLYDYLKAHYTPQLLDGRLVYYKLLTPVEGFDMAYAKRISHALALGEAVFNLDADNYIGSTLPELQSLKQGQVLTPKLFNGVSTSRCGRIGFMREDYKRLGGYDVSIRGMAGDDGDILKRAHGMGLKSVQSLDMSKPVQQTDEQKLKYNIGTPCELPMFIELQAFDGYIRQLNLAP